MRSGWPIANARTLPASLNDCIAIAWAESSDGRTVPHGCSSVNRFAGRWCTPARRELRSPWSHMRARGGTRHGRGAWTAERKPPKSRPSGSGPALASGVRRPRITRHHHHARRAPAVSFGLFILPATNTPSELRALGDGFAGNDRSCGTGFQNLP